MKLFTCPKNNLLCKIKLSTYIQVYKPFYNHMNVEKITFLIIRKD